VTIDSIKKTPFQVPSLGVFLDTIRGFFLEGVPKSFGKKLAFGAVSPGDGTHDPGDARSPRFRIDFLKRVGRKTPLVKFPKQTKTCAQCKGYGRVAIITHGPQLFASIIGIPLPCTHIEARQKLANYRGNDGRVLTALVRGLARDVDTTSCPWCNGSGVAWSLQQLTPEEDAAIRAEESS
jgi:hypothetical protein